MQEYVDFFLTEEYHHVCWRMETSEKGKIASSELVLLHFQNMKNKIRFHKKNNNKQQHN